MFFGLPWLGSGLKIKMSTSEHYHMQKRFFDGCLTRADSYWAAWNHLGRLASFAITHTLSAVLSSRLGCPYQ